MSRNIRTLQDVFTVKSDSMDIKKSAELINIGIQSGKKSTLKESFKILMTPINNKAEVSKGLDVIINNIKTESAKISANVKALTMSGIGKVNSKENKDSKLSLAYSFIKVSEGIQTLIDSSIGSRFDDCKNKILESLYPNDTAKYNYQIPGTKTNLVLALEAGMLGSLLTMSVIKIVDSMSNKRREKKFTEIFDNLSDIASNIYETSVGIYSMDEIITESFSKNPVNATKSLIRSAKYNISELLKFVDSENFSNSSRIAEIFHSTESFRGLVEGISALVSIGVGAIGTYDSYKVDPKIIKEEAAKTDGVKLMKSFQFSMGRDSRDGDANADKNEYNKAGEDQNEEKDSDDTESDLQKVADDIDTSSKE
jgi:hypothetical protein